MVPNRASGKPPSWRRGPYPGLVPRRGNWHLAVLATAVALLGWGADCGPREARVDCDEQFDAALWKRITTGRARYDESWERDRRRLARKVVKCGVVRRASRSRARELLGATDPERHGHIESWTYRLGPDWLGVDSDILVVEIDRRRNRVRGNAEIGSN